MKILFISCALAIMAFVLSREAPGRVAEILDEGPSVVGAFDIFANQGRKVHIEFHADISPDGTTKGETIFRDDTETPVREAFEGGADEQEPGLTFKAEFDCLVIEGNKAVMGGTVTEASWGRYVGRRVLIVAEENGGPPDSSKRDKVTWGIYRPAPTPQITTDAERPEEINGRAWLATDAERPEDLGVPSNQTAIIGCQSFPLSSFSFVSARQSKGTVHVRAK